MYFTIRIVRFLIRLCIKTLLLPFKIIGAVVGAGSDDTGGYEPAGVDDATDVDEAANTRENTTAGRETSTAATSVVDETARQRISWFRTGLIAVGAIELILGLLIMAEAGQMLNSDAAAVLAGALLFFGAVPLAIGWALPNHPTKAWYAGMGFVALQLIRAVVTLPAGLVWLIAYGAIGACGYTGRPALFSVYGAVAGTSLSTSPQDERTENRSNDINPSTGIEMADDTAETTDDSVPTDPRDRSSGSADAEGSVPSSPEATEAGEQVTTSDAVSGDGATTADAATTSASGEDGVDEPHSGESADDPADPSPDEDEVEDAVKEEAEASTDETPSDGADSIDIEAYRDRLAADAAEERTAAVRDLADAVADDEVPDQAAIDALSERLDDDASSVRIAACEALGRLGADDVSSRLRDLRIDPDTDVSRAASRALRELE